MNCNGKHKHLPRSQGKSKPAGKYTTVVKPRALRPPSPSVSSATHCKQNNQVSYDSLDDASDYQCDAIASTKEVDYGANSSSNENKKLARRALPPLPKIDNDMPSHLKSIDNFCEEDERQKILDYAASIERVKDVRTLVLFFSTTIMYS